MEQINYEKQGTDFLEKHGIKFKATRKADKCPSWDDGGNDHEKRDRHYHGERYLATFRRPGSKSLSLSFWNSYAAVERGETTISAYDVLSCITKSDPGTFEDFCGEYGYEIDSRKAYATYKAVVREWQKVSRFFSDDEIEELYEIQ